MTLSLHALLAQRTRPLHHTLDHTPALAALLRPGLTHDAYLRSLRGLAQAHARVEPALLALTTETSALGLTPYRPRLPALQADLQALGADPVQCAAPADAHPGSRTQGPQSLRDESTDGSARALGLRYVLDGASQGARILAPAIARALPTLPDQAFSYWRLQSQVAQDWPALRAALALPADPPTHAASLDAACWAFQQFIDVLACGAPEA